MYTIKLKFGQVIRNSDNKVIAPCQSAEDTDFLAYQTWVNTPGNEPIIDDTVPVTEVIDSYRR